MGSRSTPQISVGHLNGAKNHLLLKTSQGQSRVPPSPLPRMTRHHHRSSFPTQPKRRRASSREPRLISVEKFLKFHSMLIFSQGGVALCRVDEFTCEDGETCLPWEKICDGISDCPLHENGAGGEDEVSVLKSL